MDVEKGDVSIWYVSMNIHTVYQNNGSKLFMNYSDRDVMDMNYNSQNEDVGSIIGLLNIHNLPQANKSSNSNEMDMGVENGNVNGGHCYMNSTTWYESIINNDMDYTKKRDEISPNRSEMENNGLQVGVDIDVMLPV